MPTLSKSSSPDRRRGFTILELLIVVTIILILAGMTLATMGVWNRKAAKLKAEGQLAAIQLSLDRYFNDPQNGEYPLTTGSNGGRVLYQALTGDGDDALGGDTEATGEFGSAGETYLDEAGDESQGMIDTSTSGGTNPKELLDPYGNPWYYICPGEHNKHSYDLASLGPNGSKDTTDGIKDDIKNW